MHLIASLLAVATLYVSATALPAPQDGQPSGGIFEVKCVLPVPDSCLEMVGTGICPWNVQYLQRNGFKPSDMASLTAYCTGPQILAACDQTGTVKFESGDKYCMEGCQCVPTPEPKGPNGVSAKAWNDGIAANPYRASELGLKPIPIPSESGLKPIPPPSDSGPKPIPPPSDPGLKPIPSMTSSVLEPIPTPPN